MHRFVDGAAKPDSAIVAKQTRLGIRRPVDSRMKAQIPRYLSIVGEHGIEVLAIRCGQAFVGVDIKNPGAIGLVDRKIACGREIVAPRKMMNADRKAARFFDGIVLRTGIDENNLVDDASQGCKAVFDKASFVSDDQRRRNATALWSTRQIKLEARRCASIQARERDIRSARACSRMSRSNSEALHGK